MLFVGLALSLAQLKPKVLIEDELRPAITAKLNGYLSERLELSYQNRILAQDVDKLIEPFNNKVEDHLWQSEFWGKWFTSAVLAYKYKPTTELKTKIDKSVELIIKTQEADGYIGNYSKSNRLKQWDIWGQKYSMLGLIAYYDLTQNKKALQAAIKLADYLIQTLKENNTLIVETGNYKGMASSSVLEPIIQLYLHTKTQKYLDFAEEIVRQWELVQGPQLLSRSTDDVGSRFLPFPNEDTWATNGQKAYEMMSCYEGLLELYRITNKTEYKQAVVNTWQNIYDNEINILGSGSASECWYHGKEYQQHVTKHSQETCVTVTWIKLCQQLLRLTGDARYAAAIETSYYNALLGAMKADGSTWGMYSPISGMRSEGTNQCNMGLNCCVASGPRALFTMPFTSVMSDDKGIKINFYNSGFFQLRTPQNQMIDIKQVTNYPADGKIRMEINLPKPEKFEIAFRIPEWGRNIRLVINGNHTQINSKNNYVLIEQTWQKGDYVEFDIEMKIQTIKIEGQPEYLAFKYGPLVLARDARYSAESNMDESITPQVQNKILVEKSASSWIKLNIPCLIGSWRLLKYAEPVPLSFIDYASAGNTFSPASQYRVWFPQLLDVTNEWNRQYK